MEMGAGDGACAVRNVEAFREYLLSARSLVDVTSPDQGVTQSDSAEERVAGTQRDPPFSASWDAPPYTA
jgi:hypothetical protein